jgi:copper chaperone CopZ
MSSHIRDGGWDVVVTVPDMRCRHDVRMVSAAITDVDGVVAMQVDVDSGTIRIEGDASPGLVRAAIVAAGYRVTCVSRSCGASAS